MAYAGVNVLIINKVCKTHLNIFLPKLLIKYFHICNILATILIAALVAVALASDDEESLVGCPTLSRVLAMAESPDIIQPLLERSMNKPHQLNCQMYLECGTERDGHLRPALRICEDGYLFDANTTECVESEKAECGPRLDVFEASLFIKLFFFYLINFY